MSHSVRTTVAGIESLIELWITAVVIASASTSEAIPIALVAVYHAKVEDGLWN